MTRHSRPEGRPQCVGTPGNDTPEQLPDATTIAPLDRRSAEKLTAEIKAWAGTLWLKLEAAYDGQAHHALGYATWADYLRTEFDISRSRGYQLVVHAKAVRALAETAGVDDMSTMVDTLPERTTRDLDVPAATVSVAEAVADLDEDATDEVRAATVAATVAAISKAKKKAAQPPTFGFRRKHLAQLDALVIALAGANIAFDGIRTGADLDGSLTSEEAARVASDLSTQIRSLNRICNAIKEVAS